MIGADGRSEVHVALSDSTGYPVRVGPGCLDDLPGLLDHFAAAHQYALIADESVMRIHGARVLELMSGNGRTVTAHSFPAGEEHKCREEWARLTDALLGESVGRDGCVVALGGGVTGDLAGFVAATYMRGIPLVHLPTSLVAMVDSSVGGKTGVDVPLGKNLVGAFHPPRFVLIDPDLAETLPRSDRSQGLAEAVKHGAIMDGDYLREIRDSATELLAGDSNATARMVTRSIQLKAEVVSRDEREGGLRQVLNFGHTLGHAFEAASGYRMPHGSAVALGMVLEARLGEHLGVTRDGVARELMLALEEVELSVEIPEASDPDVLLDLLSRDKKARGGVARIVLLQDIGRVDPGDGWSHSIDSEVVREFLAGTLDGRGGRVDGWR